MERTCIIGGTGFVGAEVLALATPGSIPLRCLIRQMPTAMVRRPNGCEFVRGDATDRVALGQALDNARQLICLTNLLSLDVPLLLRAAESSGVRRAVFISSASIFSSIHPKTKARRLLAERHIRESSLATTILRPTMIYGNSRDRNMSRLIRYLRRCPLVVVPGDGKSLMHPVYVRDIAWSVLACMSTDKTRNMTYNLGGGTVFSFNDMIDTVATALGRRLMPVHVHPQLLIAVSELCRRIGFRSAIKPDQWRRLLEDKVVDNGPAMVDFAYNPISFQTGITNEISSLLQAASGSRFSSRPKAKSNPSPVRSQHGSV